MNLIDLVTKLRDTQGTVTVNQGVLTFPDGTMEDLSGDVNNFEVTVDLNIFDDEGNIIDGATKEMSLAAISDVVDHASQLTLVARSSHNFEEIEPILCELDEALSVSDVIEPSFSQTMR